MIAMNRERAENNDKVIVQGKIGSNFTITIPAEVREVFKCNIRDNILWIGDENEIVIRRLPVQELIEKIIKDKK